MSAMGSITHAPAVDATAGSRGRFCRDRRPAVVGLEWTGREAHHNTYISVGCDCASAAQHSVAIDVMFAAQLPSLTCDQTLEYALSAQPDKGLHMADAHQAAGARCPTSPHSKAWNAVAKQAAHQLGGSRGSGLVLLLALLGRLQLLHGRKAVAANWINSTHNGGQQQARIAALR